MESGTSFVNQIVNASCQPSHLSVTRHNPFDLSRNSTSKICHKPIFHRTKWNDLSRATNRCFFFASSAFFGSRGDQACQSRSTGSN
uniref:Uncharacterized protein n=1 Tax=Caenorhabditis japonica TaxID=281687 RepID=A0A8R1EIE2_CAEJA